VGSQRGQRDLFDDESHDDLPLVNALRDDVRRWREAGWRGASNVTRELLRHWAREDAPRRLFFCQREAVETLIYLAELRMPGRSSRTGFKNFALSDADIGRLLAGQKPSLDAGRADFHPTLCDRPADSDLGALTRLCCKMATGSGKTVVMAPETTEDFANRVLKDLAERMPILVLSDEGHHCWRPRAKPDASNLAAEDKAALEQELREARVWIDGLDKLNNAPSDRKSGIAFCVDLSATPFFIQGSGYPEGRPFPWIVSDFGLVDAIAADVANLTAGLKQHTLPGGGPIN